MHRHPAAGIGHASPLGDDPCPLRRNHVQYRGLVDGAKERLHLTPLHVHALHLAIIRLAHPLDHVSVFGRPALLEQRLLGKIVLRVQQQDLAARLVLLEVVRHHAGPLIGPRRAAIRQVGNHHHEGAAIGHGAQLPVQQLRLLACLPGVRGNPRSRLVITRQRIPAEIDARRQYQPVPLQRAAVGQAHGPGRRIHILGPRMHHVHAVGPQTVIAVTDALERAQAPQIEIGERAGIEARRRLDQRHLHFGGELTQIAGRRGAPKAAAHHHHMGRGRPGAHECRHGQHGSPGGQHLSATGPESLIRLHLDIAIPIGQGGIEGIGQEASGVGCRGLKSAGHCAAGAPGLSRPMSGR